MQENLEKSLDRIYHQNIYFQLKSLIIKVMYLLYLHTYNVWKFSTSSKSLKLLRSKLPNSCPHTRISYARDVIIVETKPSFRKDFLRDTGSTIQNMTRYCKDHLMNLHSLKEILLNPRKNNDKHAIK